MLTSGPSYELASLQTYGANVDQLKAEVGGTVKESDIEVALKSKKYKLVTVTHVDTSTGMSPCRFTDRALYGTDVGISRPVKYQGRGGRRSQSVSRYIGTCPSRNS
jgi:hypothetical protein